jgi:hypothetical protein
MDMIHSGGITNSAVPLRKSFKSSNLAKSIG